MPIKLKTKLGKIALSISAVMRNDENLIAKVLAFGLQYLVWHIVPAKAYEKTAPYRRDSAYSDKLAQYLADKMRDVLSPYFENIEIETSEYVAPDSAEGILAKLDKMSDADIARIQAKIAAKQAKPVASANMAQAA